MNDHVRSNGNGTDAFLLGPSGVSSLNTGGRPVPNNTGVRFSYSKMMDLERREYYFHFTANQMMKFEGLVVCVREESVRRSSTSFSWVLA